jgi:hypothetical protein
MSKTKTLLLKALEARKSNFAFHFHFARRIQDSGGKNVWIRIWEEKMVGSGIKHPGSATLDIPIRL